MKYFKPQVCMSQWLPHAESLNIVFAWEVCVCVCVCVCVHACVRVSHA